MPAKAGIPQQRIKKQSYFDKFNDSSGCQLSLA
jgi:hypothetical protein